MNENLEGVYRKPETQRLTGLSDNTIKRLVQRGEFPKPIQLSPRTIGWRRQDIKEWLASRAEAALPRVPPKKQAA